MDRPEKAIAALTRARNTLPSITHDDAVHATDYIAYLEARVRELEADSINAGRRACEASHALEVAQLQDRIEELEAEIARLSRGEPVRQ